MAKTKTILIDEHYFGPAGNLAPGEHTLEAGDADYLLRTFSGPPFNARVAGDQTKTPPRADSEEGLEGEEEPETSADAQGTLSGPPFDCPYCDEYEGPSLRGLTAHVRMKHPDELEAFEELKALVPAEDTATGPAETK